MRKLVGWGAAALAAIAVVVGVLGTELGWHWGDVPTWVAAVATVLALVAAASGAVGVFRQLDVLREQVRLQAEQAAEDRAKSEQQAQRDLELRSAERREQAEQVEVKPVDSYTTAKGVDLYLAFRVMNNSSRPVQNVVCRLALGSNGRPMAPDFIRGTQGDDLGTRHTKNGLVVHRETGFIFGFGVDYRDSESPCLVRFTDDAGLHWELTDDMHLKPVPDRSDW